MMMEEYSPRLYCGWLWNWDDLNNNKSILTSDMAPAEIHPPPPEGDTSSQDGMTEYLHAIGDCSRRNSAKQRLWGIHRLGELV